MRNRRKYNQQLRAEQQLSTRQRIVDALVALHGEIGPARTSISAVAERAGVQRLTIYRHFADETAMLEACSAHYATLVPPPDATRWEHINDPAKRLRSALLSFYDYYARGEPMLTQVLRDAPEMPALTAILKPWNALMSAVKSELSEAWTAPHDRQRMLGALIGHALRFETWVSPVRAEQLQAEEAAELIVTSAKHIAGRFRPEATRDAAA